jgi:hypothetical protein
LEEVAAGRSAGGSSRLRIEVRFVYIRHEDRLGACRTAMRNDCRWAGGGPFTPDSY